MTPCTRTARTCRRQMMLAAVAAAVLLLTAAPAAYADNHGHDGPPAAMFDKDKDGKDLPPVSDAELATAKAEYEKLKGMTADARADYLFAKRENRSFENFEAHKAERRAMHAYIKSLPEDERAAFKAQMKADHEAVKAKKKAKWDAMTPEEREAAKAKKKAEYDKLPDDVKAKMKEKREKMKEKYGERKKDAADKEPVTTPAE